MSSLFNNPGRVVGFCRRMPKLTRLSRPGRFSHLIEAILEAMRAHEANNVGDEAQSADFFTRYVRLMHRLGTLFTQRVIQRARRRYDATVHQA